MLFIPSSHDADCADIFLHAWYLDHGALAGKSSSVLKELDILQSLGPPLGFVISGLKLKFELLGHCDCSNIKIISNMEIFRLMPI